MWIRVEEINLPFFPHPKKMLNYRFSCVNFCHVKWGNHTSVANMEAAFCHVNYANVERWFGVFLFNLTVYHYFCPLFFDKLARQVSSSQELCFAHLLDCTALCIRFMVVNCQPVLSLCFKLKVIIFNLWHSMLFCKHIFTNDPIWSIMFHPRSSLVKPFFWVHTLGSTCLFH